METRIAATTCHETIDTPDGPFGILEHDGVVVASGWTADLSHQARKAGYDLSQAVVGPVTSADAVRAYYAGEWEPVNGVAVNASGTAFQEAVWEQLRRIPSGEVWTYGHLASSLGRPASSRPVGQACGANPVALFVPCHRVVGAGGALTGFGWGVEVKCSLLERERNGDG